MELLTHLQKGLASVALSSVAFFGMASAASLGFTDDAEIPSWAEEAIEELMDQGVVAGNGDGSFAPNRQLNRAEVSKIIVLATGIDMDTTGGPHFPDVTDDAWYYDFVETMYNQGWINGYPDGLFRPGVGINRAEIAKMVVNGFELDQDLSGAPHFDDVTSGDWYYGYVETIYNNGCMRGYGDGTFGPGNAVTRAETVKIVYDCQLVALGGFNGVAEGTVELALSNDTPRGTNIPFNATSVPFTTVELTASDDADVEISSMTFTRLGLGDNDDFENVWLEIDGFKVGNDKSVNNDDVVELRFNPPIVVPAGQTIVADVVASMKFSSTDKNTGHHNRFVLVSADDIVSSAANIAGDFPVEGEEMEVADYEVTNIEFGSLGSDTTVEVGDAFVEIGKFKLENQSSTNKDIEARAITFKNDGTAEMEDVLENVGLYVSGEQVSAETIIDGDYITFRLDNGVTGGYIIEDGDSKIFSIRADVVSAEKGDTLNFKVDNFEDVVAVEIGTAFGVRAESDGDGFALNGGSTDSATCANGDDAEDNCARLKAYSIDSGDINISRDPSSLSNQEYAPGSNDVVFLTARVVVDQPVIVDGVRIDIEQATDVAGNHNITTVEGLNNSFDNFRLYVNDKLIDTENEFVDGAKDYLDFGTTFELAGTSVIKLVGNIESHADNGDEVKVAINADAFDSPEYISTGDQIESSQILGSAVASFVEIQQSVLEIARTDGFSNETIVAGVDDVTVMKFVLDSNDSGDVNVTSITIDADGDGAASTFGNFTAAIFVDGVQQGSSRNLESNGKSTFNDLSVTIPSSGQKEFELVIDTLEASGGTVTGAGGTVMGMPTEICANGSKTDSNATMTCSSGTFPNPVSIGTITMNGDNISVLVADTDGDNSLTVDPLSVDGTDTGAISTITSPYTSSTIYLSSLANVTVGDSLTIGGNACTVASLDATAGTVTCSEPAFLVTTGDPVAEPGVGGSSQIIFSVEAVNADNVENGNEVDVVLAGTTTDLAGDDTGSNPAVATEVAGTDVDGVIFALVTGGELTVADGATIVNSSNIIVANATEVEVYKIRLSAAYDDIEIKDFYFVNDIAGDDTATTTTIHADDEAGGDRVDFKLYDEAGSLIQTKQMIGGKLHFELANADRIQVPKDNSTTLTLKVDARDITEANQTGKGIAIKTNKTLGLTDANAASGTSGVEAVTSSTGADLTEVKDDTTNSEDYVLYRTTLVFANAASQPSFVASGTESAVFRFTVSNDDAYEAILDQVTVALTANGPTLAAGAANYRLVKYSSSDYSGTPTVLDEDATGGIAGLVFAGLGDEVDGTNYYEVRAEGGYTNTASDNDSIIGSFVNGATAAATYLTSAAAVGEDIVWSDRSDNGGAGAFINGFELVLPSTSAGVQE